MTQKRKRRVFTEQFKKQMVDLVLSGKPQGEIIREYDLTPSSLPTWVKQNSQSGSFKIIESKIVFYIFWIHINFQVLKTSPSIFYNNFREQLQQKQVSQECLRVLHKLIGVFHPKKGSHHIH